MDVSLILLLVGVGIITGLTTVLFGFGGGFVTVPVIMWVDAATGEAAATIAVAMSSVMMIVTAAVATAATRRDVLARLRHTTWLLVLLAIGGLLGALAALGAPAGVIAWGFVGYLALTIVDASARPGFLAARAHGEAARRVGLGIPTLLGLPIGGIAAFLGVGGSVMTVPMLRRAGMPMRLAAALANPLTLCVSLPACVVYLIAEPIEGAAGVVQVGAVDVGAVGLLLLGAVPTIVAVRRRPPRVPDRVHALGYIVLLVVVLLAMLVRLWIA